MWRLTVFALFALPVAAQFDSLATNYDGSVVYFTSKLRLQGTTQNEYSKAFAADASGVRLVLQRDREVLPGVTWPVTTYYSIEGIDSSGDGRTMAITGGRECHGGSGCIPIPRYQTDIIAGGAVIASIQGRGSISRNARYVLTCCDGTMVGFAQVRDLQTGQQRLVMGTFAFHQRGAVSSTGVAAVPLGTRLVLLTPTSSRDITLPAIGGPCAIDDTAGRIVCQLNHTDSTYTLVAVNPDIGRATTIASSSEPMHPALSANGETLLYRADGALSLHDFNTGQMRVISGLSTLDAVLSGDGRTAYATSTAGALLRIDVNALTVEHAFPPATAIDARVATQPPHPVAGSFFRIPGRGFTAGVTVLLDNSPIPVVSANATEAVVQIPWNASDGFHDLDALNPGPSTFAQETVRLFVRERMPQFLFPNVAVHAAWDRLVSSDHPVHPGDIIHVYMAGLGRVAGPMEDGVAAPGAAWTLAPFSCRVDEQPAEVLYAGLAPGMIGLYQVSLRLPQQLRIDNGAIPLTCGDAEAWFDRTRLPAQI